VSKVAIRQPRYAQIFADDPEMCAVATEKWREVVEHLKANDWVTAGRLSVADRYARAYAEYEKHYPQAVAEGPVKVGPNGGDLFNFLWSVVEKLNERLAKLEAKLKIDPDGEATVTTARGPKTKADEYLED
jgi:phage terminase small subunit